MPVQHPEKYRASRFSARRVIARVTQTSLLLALAGGAHAAATGYSVVTDSGDVLGLFGGATTTLNNRGETIGALTVVTDTGYLVQMSDAGDVGLPGSAFYTEAGCSGDEYLPATGTGQTPPPLAGTVYRSLASGQLRYIPQYTRSERVNVRSQLYFTAGALKCGASEVARQLLPTVANNPEVTGYEHSISGQTLALKPPSSAGSGGLISSLSAKDDVPPPPLPTEQQECSPGCTWGDTGNKVCDIACYVDACGYDEGDCNNESAEFIQEELAKFCSPGRTTADIGDGFCDTACNTSACDFDSGDCAID